MAVELQHHRMEGDTLPLLEGAVMSAIYSPHNYTRLEKWKDLVTKWKPLMLFIN